MLLNEILTWDCLKEANWDYSSIKRDIAQHKKTYIKQQSGSCSLRAFLHWGRVPEVGHDSGPMKINQSVKTTKQLNSFITSMQS